MSLQQFLDSTNRPSPVSAYNPLPVGGGGRSPSAIFTPAAAAYLANDIFEGAKEFTNCGPPGSLLVILSVSLMVAHTALIASEGAYGLHLYSITPPSAPADNAAFDVPSGDRASYLGRINLGTPADIGSTLWIKTDGINTPVQLASGSRSLFGLLVTDAGFTPTAAARTVQIFTEPL